MTYRGRGRPKKLLTPDGPTHQLQAKHARGMTRSPLDALLMQGVLSPDEHWAGLHLRRLHAVFYGCAAPSSSFFWLEKATAEPPSAVRLAQMRDEYRHAQQLLDGQGVWRACLQLVQADYPGILPDSAQSYDLYAGWSGGISGCRLLGKVWCKKSISLDVTNNCK